MDEWRKLLSGEPYEVSRSGKVRRLGAARPLQGYKNAHNRFVAVIIANGIGYHNQNAARLVYEAWSGKKLGPKETIGYHDNDWTNTAYENLYVRSHLRVGPGKKLPMRQIVPASLEGLWDGIMRECLPESYASIWKNGVPLAPNVKEYVTSLFQRGMVEVRHEAGVRSTYRRRFARMDISSAGSGDVLCEEAGL